MPKPGAPASGPIFTLPTPFELRCFRNAPGAVLADHDRALRPQRGLEQQEKLCAVKRTLRRKRNCAMNARIDGVVGVRELAENSAGDQRDIGVLESNAILAAFDARAAAVALIGNPVTGRRERWRKLACGSIPGRVRRVHGDRLVTDRAAIVYCRAVCALRAAFRRCIAGGIGIGPARRRR